MENKNERAVISNWVHFEQMQFLYVLIKYGCRSSEVSSNSASLDPVEVGALSHYFRYFMCKYLLLCSTS